ncbi:MAG: DUF4215 domain-containing protein [Sandaracinaceae bacterium]
MGDVGGLDMGPPDPCVGVSTCDEAGTSCDGEELVACEADADGCLIETRTDCAEVGGGFCDGDASLAECAVDPCFGLEDACAVERRTCQGDELVVCAPNANGCLVEMRTDCSSGGEGFCDVEADPPVCVAPVDPCEGLANACLVEGSSCDGDEVVKCAPNAFGCLVESRTDCDAGRATCVVGGLGAQCAGAPSCPPPADTLCEDAGVSCDGPELVACAPDPFGCLRETRTLCTDVQNGFCDEDAEMCGVSARPLCRGVPQCSPEGRACDDTELVVCAVDPRGCRVETRTDCPEQGDVCDDTGDIAICGESMCPQAPEVVGCDAGTRTGDTADGTSVFRRYACIIGERAGGRETGWQFQTDDDVRVTFTATPTMSTTDDYDLFVLDGSTSSQDCSEDSPCLGRGEDPGATEEVVVDVRAEQLLYVFYDAMGNAATHTTPFDLEITCETPVCGNGVLDAFETCDDGNTDFGDGCAGPPPPGEEGEPCIVEPGFECDDAEPSVCTPLCGNGALDPMESCDDGERVAGDGCSPDCQVEPGFSCSGAPSVCVSLCGNGALDEDETCDDGNNIDGDGCDAECGGELDGSDRITISGTINSRDPTFNRPFAFCTANSTPGYFYDEYRVTNTGTTSLVVSVGADWLPFFVADGYLHAYDAPFDPADPTQNCITGNDDSCSIPCSFVQFTLDAGDEAVVVASTFSSGATISDYTITITTP